MAIKKGQFTDEKTGDVLYPQTSSDMVEGLANNYYKNSEDIILSSRKSVLGTDTSTGEEVNLIATMVDDIYVGSSNHNMRLSSLDIPTVSIANGGITNEPIVLSKDLRGNLVPHSLITSNCGLVDRLIQSTVLKEVINEGVAVYDGLDKVTYDNLGIKKGKITISVFDATKRGTPDDMYFEVRYYNNVHGDLGSLKFQAIYGNEESLEINAAYDIDKIVVYKNIVGISTNNTSGVLNIGTFKVKGEIGEEILSLLYAGENFKVLDNGKIRCTGFVSENNLTWQSNYEADAKVIALKDDIPNKSDIVNMIYPIGSIYMSISNTSPSSLFGGTWASWGTGRVPVGVDTNDQDFNVVEKLGGTKNVQLNALIGNIEGNLNKLGYRTDNTVLNNTSYNAELNVNYGNTSGSHSASHSTPVKDRNTGENPSTLQPYITCFMWKRTG